jgi:hypothetical protein
MDFSCDEIVDFLLLETTSNNSVRVDAKQEKKG